MRIKLISVISLILIVASGCQSSQPTSQTASPPTAAMTCLINNPIIVNPDLPPNLGDTCLSKNDSTNNAVTWLQGGANPVRFKVRWTVFVPAPGNSNTYPYTLGTCQVFSTKCEPGTLTGHSEGTAYYEVTLDKLGNPTMNGRIIIRP